MQVADRLNRGGEHVAILHSQCGGTPEPDSARSSGQDDVAGAKSGELRDVAHQKLRGEQEFAGVALLHDFAVGAVDVDP